MRYLCFDDGGETIDRYTIFYKRHGWEPWRDYLAASAAPFHPQGFGQHGESDPFYRRADMAHLGEPIRFAALPADVQKFALQQQED